MSDFYAVLKQSILDQDLRSQQDRDAAYAQARAAVVRRLWAYDPPLSDDEIDARIGQFDIAVEQIESDVVEAFSVTPEFDDHENADVVDGLDVALALQDVPTDDALANGEAPEDLIHFTGADAVPLDAPEWEPAADPADDLDARSLAIEQALNSEPDDTWPAQEADPPLDGGFDNLHQANAVEERQPDRAISPSEGASESADRLAPEIPVAAPAGHLEQPSARSGAVAESAEKRRSKRQERRPNLRNATESPALAKSRSRPLVLIVSVLAVALIAAALYIFVPLSRETGEEPTTPPEPPTAGPSSRTGVAPAADSVQRFTLFDGSDPTVFLAAPGNPVRFTGDAARISTSAGSAGANALIGPGLAARLAGHNVRVTVMARTVRENGAASMRIAFQSGLAISHWQNANLTPTFAPTELTWRVPTMRTDPSGGAIIVEPGIPGDGTAVEIGAITIDVLD
ncbi:hypothetical protein [Bauldia sp.]|uniref:hypothetical protein n=1 Tax=Bauldia sp. TaxID=2575872 RepID=UPI003BAD4073